ncbi:hypothetical protein [Rheinheimera sp.]|uniref:hypothetical protein n=1 Tax=Rheinheimera sp. TaxID=1869214 RepID=UPI0040474D5E
MLGYQGSPAAEQQQDATIFAGINSTYRAAQRFFQLAARQADDSNLRFHFNAMSTVHQQAIAQLPAPTATQPSHNNELAAIELWYLHQQLALHSQPLHTSLLAELVTVLQQQITVLKQLTHAAASQHSKVTLAHLSAALQIASDRLLPLLQVLPIATQKLQTIN